MSLKYADVRFIVLILPPGIIFPGPQSCLEEESLLKPLTAICRWNVAGLVMLY